MQTYTGDGQLYLVDTEYVFDLISPESFTEFHHQQTDTKCLDIADKPIKRVMDEQARALIKKQSSKE